MELSARTSDIQGPPFVPRTRAQRRRSPSLVDVTLDPAQRSAIALPQGHALLVLGEAGHGKTTVLLHRVAKVWRDSHRSLRAVVLVPGEGLARLLQALLTKLGVDIDVWTFDHFAAKQARRAFRRLPRESDATPPSVMRLKRSAALWIALDEIAAREPGLIDDDRDASRPRRGPGNVTRGDLQHLFGDRVLVERVANAAALPPYVVEDVLERTRVQFSPTTEREWSHIVDRERLVAVDGRHLDDGTATGHAHTVDVEDYAVLFELDRLRAVRRKITPSAPRAYDLIAIDEAQELAPLELALIGRSLAPGGSLVAAGDKDQHTDETSSFIGWESAMSALGASEYATVTLDIGYRCPPEVVAIARAVRDGSRSVCAQMLVFDDEQTLASELGSAMASVLRRDRHASIAVICRQAVTARRLVASFRRRVAARLVFDGRFLPRGPIQVTTVDEVKGLEFDYVVVADASARMWPDDAATRRALYVAITRARHQVVFASVGPPALKHIV